MQETSITFPSGALLLEGRLGLPGGNGPFPAVIVCHPHPLYGGSMDNNVVNSLCEELVRASIISLRFNFRGVGRSQGKHSYYGTGEQEDVAAAVAFVSEQTGVDSGRIGLAGYSAGAGYAINVSVLDSRVKALAAISPPLKMFDFTPLKDCSKPKFLVSGGRDDFTPAEQFLQFCQGLAEPRECHSAEEADHFWHGHEKVMAEMAADFFTRALNE